MLSVRICVIDLIKTKVVCVALKEELTHTHIYISRLIDTLFSALLRNSSIIQLSVLSVLSLFCDFLLLDFADLSFAVRI